MYINVGICLHYEIQIYNIAIGYLYQGHLILNLNISTTLATFREAFCKRRENKICIL